MSVYGTGDCVLKLRRFSREHDYRRCHLARGARCTVGDRLGCGFACTLGAYLPSTCIRRHAGVPLLRHSIADTASDGILTVSSIGTGSRLCLRARLTLIRLALIRKPWSCGEGVLAPFVVTYTYICFSGGSSISQDTPSTPPECSPTNGVVHAIPRLRYRTYARLLSTRDRSTGELLRTL